jgi:hypothetical protein
MDGALASLDPEALDAAAEALKTLATRAPEEVREDVEILESSVTALARAVRDGSDDPVEAAEGALRDAPHSAEAVTLAGESVVAYAQATCGIDLISTSTTVSTIVPGTDGPNTGLD